MCVFVGQHFVGTLVRLFMEYIYLWWWSSSSKCRLMKQVSHHHHTTSFNLQSSSSIHMNLDRHVFLLLLLLIFSSFFFCCKFYLINIFPSCVYVCLCVSDHHWILSVTHIHKRIFFSFFAFDKDSFHFLFIFFPLFLIIFNGLLANHKHNHFVFVVVVNQQSSSLPSILLKDFVFFFFSECFYFLLLFTDHWHDSSVSFFRRIFFSRFPFFYLNFSKNDLHFMNNRLDTEKKQPNKQTAKILFRYFIGFFVFGYKRTKFISRNS